MAKQRLDKVVLDLGLAPSRERARAMILAGKVYVGGQRVDKAGAQIASGAEVTVKEADHPYVSRGALKLEHGLTSFAIDPSGKVAIDVGASTGGFTDVLLRRGARKVYAIDVGYGQLAWSLRTDPRVVAIERTNMREMELSMIPEAVDLATIDVSFISLTLVLPRVVDVLRAHDFADDAKWIVALVKPQFEVGRDRVGKGGVVRDEEARRDAIAKVEAFAPTIGLHSHGWVESPIRGPAGNVEYLIAMRLALRLGVGDDREAEASPQNE